VAHLSKTCQLERNRNLNGFTGVLFSTALEQTMLCLISF